MRGEMDRMFERFEHGFPDSRTCSARTMQV